MYRAHIAYRNAIYISINRTNNAALICRAAITAVIVIRDREDGLRCGLSRIIRRWLRGSREEKNARA